MNWMGISPVSLAAAAAASLMVACSTSCFGMVRPPGRSVRWVEPDQHEHDWVLDEVNLTSRGADRGESCWCGAVRYVPAQAALRDTRPPL
jgi:hypothetical protein